MAKVSKFFRVAVEGATTDGRVIERNWLTEAAASYNRQTYDARVNMEHIRGMTADKPFRALGNVLALRTEEVELELGGKKQKKLALMAQIEPNDDLLTINAAGQKLYTSIEIAPSFADTKQAYLVGLAVTDSPASLGTELLQFAAGQGDANPLKSRKLHDGNLFSAASETAFEFEDKAVDQPSESAGLIQLATEFFKNFGKDKKEPATPPVVPPTPANDNPQFAELLTGIGKLTAAVGAVADDVTKLTGTVGTLKAEHETLKASVETTEKPNGFRRQPATGGNGGQLTDC